MTIKSTLLAVAVAAATFAAMPAANASPAAGMMMSGAAVPAPSGLGTADATVHKVHRRHGHRRHRWHGHGHGWHGGGFTFYAPVYHGGGCHWMKRKWRRTGNRYWRKRYYRCVNRYY
jgi:hypothetical protein